MAIIFIQLLNTLSENFLLTLNIEAMIREEGVIIIFLAVYAQTGLFFSFFLPSGIFLFTGGMFIATGQLEQDLFTFCGSLVFACILGCCTGYFFGRKTGTILYQRKDSKFFKKRYLKAADVFYQKYGQFALTVGLLFPITRTFAPIVAGIINMNFGLFLFLVVLGSILWVVPFIFAGYLIGSVPVFKEYSPYIITFFLVIVTTPVVIRIVKEMRKGGKD
jgi:membrane-associated protein